MPAKTRQAPATSLDQLVKRSINKYGDGKVVRRDSVEPYEVIPTGSLSLDLALRTGGWIKGRISEIVGPEGVGKTTVCISSMVEAQRKYPDLAVGIVDMEQTFDYDWAESLGLDTSKKRWHHIYPDNSEDVSDQTKEAIETGLFSILVVDSIGAMESQQAFDKDADGQVMGRNAQVITRMVKRLAVQCRATKTGLILVNQYRANIANPMGPDISAGPKAMAYATTVKVQMSRTGGEPLKYKFPDDDEPQTVGLQFRARVARSKVAPQGKKAEFYIINNPTDEHGPVGIDKADEAYMIGVQTGVIEVQGGGYHWMPWTTDPKGRIHGQPATKAYLRLHPEKALEVRDAAVAAMASEVIPSTMVDFDPATGEAIG